MDNNTAFLVLSADKYFVRLTRTNNFNCELRTCSRSLHRMFQAKLHIQLAIIQQLMHEASFHSFIQSISIVPLQVHYYSEALPTQHGYCAGVLTLRRHRQLLVKDLPKVCTWQLERDTSPRPSGWKVSTQPMRHHVPCIWTFQCPIVCKSHMWFPLLYYDNVLLKPFNTLDTDCTIWS